MNTQEILNKLDNMNLSERARNYINSCDQGAIATLADLTEEAIEKEAFLDSIIGKTYEDPEGIWEVTNTTDNSV